MNGNDRVGADERVPLSRRRWLVATLYSGLATLFGMQASRGKALAAETRKDGASQDDRGTHIYNVRNYGAKGDGTTLDTAAVQAAIDVCHEAGGGTVVVSAGVFQVGTIELKSNVTFRIAAGGKILGSADGKQYHPVEAIPLSGDASLDDGNWALFFAVNASNITIEGPGTINGQGAQFYAKEGALPPSGLGDDKRPYHLLFYRCEDLTVRNLSLLDSAYHSVRVIQSQRVHMDSLYIHNRVNINNDGFHFISVQHGTIANCIVESQDDACAMFGSCQYLTITNCSFSTRWSVFRFGGGVVKNIAISNCLLHHVYGCPIKFQGNSRSVFENLSFANLVLDDVTGPIHVSLGPTIEDAQAAGGGIAPVKDPSVFRNVSFANITGTVTTNPPDPPFPGVQVGGYHLGEKYSCIALNSVGESVIENVSFSDVHLTFGGGGTVEYAERTDLPAFAGEYFELGTMPAYGLYARHVRGLTLENVRFEVSKGELRPAVVFDDVADASMVGFSAQGNVQAESLLRFMNVRDVLLCACRVLHRAAVFLEVEGAQSGDISMQACDLHNALSRLAFKRGATDDSVHRA